MVTGAVAAIVGGALVLIALVEWRGRRARPMARKVREPRERVTLIRGGKGAA